MNDVLQHLRCWNHSRVCNQSFIITIEYFSFSKTNVRLLTIELVKYY